MGPRDLGPYAFVPPTAFDVRLALQRHVGLAGRAAVWQHVRRAVGVRRSDASLPTADLVAVAEYLASQEGVTRVVGQSLWIRLRTHAVLARGRGDTHAVVSDGWARAIADTY